MRKKVLTSSVIKRRCSRAKFLDLTAGDQASMSAQMLSAQASA